MKIPIKKYVMNESLSWEERYKELEKHHKEETDFLINEVKRLEFELEHNEDYLYEATRKLGW